MPNRAVGALSELLSRPEGAWTLVEGALAVARLNQPELDAAAVQRRLADLGERARRALGAAWHPRFVAAGVGRVLFAEADFRAPGPGEESPACLFLDQALVARLAAPPLLALLFIEVARRAGFRFGFIALPGRSLVLADYAGAPQVFDPVHQARPLSLTDCQRLVAHARAASAEFRRGWLRPLTQQQVLARLLSNLKTLFWRLGEYEQALDAIEMLLTIRPDDPRELRDSGRLLFLLDRRDEAIRAFETYLADNPSCEDANAVRLLLLEARTRLSG